MKMKNTVPFHINFLVFALVLFYLSGCNQPIEKSESLTKEVKTKEFKAKKKKPSKVSKKKFVSLTNSNLEKELLEYGKENRETLVLLKTPLGNMKIKLYENTPLHRANFIRLIKNNFYKETQFYRVVNNFMIQGDNL